MSCARAGPQNVSRSSRAESTYRPTRGRGRIHAPRAPARPSGNRGKLTKLKSREPTHTSQDKSTPP